MAQSSSGGGGPQQDVSKAETEVTYYIDEEEAPYRTKIQKHPSEVVLADFKAILPARLHQFKYFFKNKDEEFGIVKQEILDESSNLPLFNGQIVSWLVVTEGSMVSEGGLSGLERGPGVGQTRPPSFHGGRSANNVIYRDEDIDTESAITSVSQQAENMRNSSRRPRIMSNGGTGSHNRQHVPRLPGTYIFIYFFIQDCGHSVFEILLLQNNLQQLLYLGPGIPAPGPRQPTETETSSSMMSSEIESSLYESEDAQSQASSRFTTSTDHTSVSRQLMNMRHRPKKRSSRRVPAHLARHGSMSSVTDSTLSLNVITVTLNMDTVNFLGISIVGQSSREGQGDVGIYVGSIMKGGAVALDGRIDPGDMILQVNEISFDNMSNDDAVKVLKDVVQKPGPIRLVVAKSWDPAPSSSHGRAGGLTLPSSDPVRPIDPGAWVAHTAAIRGKVFFCMCDF